MVRMPILRSSDIDVGIMADKKLQLRQLWEFKEALNSTPNLYSFDVIDFNDVSDSFKAIALRDIETLLA